MDKTKLFISEKLRLAITNQCNFSCFYCHNEGQGHNCKPEFLSLDYIKDLVAFIMENNISLNKINITGGEPLLHPNLFEIVEELAKTGAKLRINTNGSLLTEKKIDDLVEKGVTSFKIGVDTFFENQSKFNIHKLVQNIDELKHIISYAGKRVGVVLNCVVTKKNHEQVPEIIELCKELGVKRLKLIDLHDFDARHTNDQENVSDELKTVKQLATNQFEEMLRKYSATAREVVNYEYLGRYDIVMSDGFMLRFCKDICNSRACGNSFTSFNAKGELILCQKANKSHPINFKENPKEVIAMLSSYQQSICNKLTKRYDMFETNYALV